MSYFENIVNKWSHIVKSGMPDINNFGHKLVLRQVLLEEGWDIRSANTLIDSLVEADDKDDYVHLSRGIYVKSGDEDKEGAQKYKKTDDGKFEPIEGEETPEEEPSQKLSGPEDFERPDTEERPSEEESEKDGTKTISVSGVTSESIDGIDGDLSLNITSNGIGLFGKVRNRWYRFGMAQEVGHKGRINPKNKFLKQDLSIRNLDVFKKITSSTDLTLDVADNITLNADGGTVTIKDGSDSHFQFHCDRTRLRIYDDTNADDYCTMEVGAEGATTISTYDNDGTAGHLTLAPDGDLVLDPGSQKIIINATDGLYFDGGTETYVIEASGDQFRFYVGGKILMLMQENGSGGNYVHFGTNGAAAGFTRIEAIFSNSDTVSGNAGTIGVIDSGGTDDTDIDFRHTNKFRLELTGDITTVNLIFPPVAGNFLLVCTTNGDHDVTNWKVYENDESAATTTDVMRAGGSVPVFTNSGVDIVSFYWDADEQQAYGVASLAFATP